MASRLGIDVGGTFTDLLLFDDESGRISLFKTPSTPEDQSIGILTGVRGILDRSGESAGKVSSLLHGTTVSTNIVLEEKGARVGLLVTADFEQILHLARSQTPGPLAGWMIMQKPDPLADLEHTRGVPERMSARGDVVRPLDEAGARAAIEELVTAGVESITISLLHAYANPAHERRLAELVHERAPELPVTIASDILAEFREYERTLVAVMNAYVGPSMRRYLGHFEAKLREVDFSPHVHIVRSDGGLMSVAHASESPVHTMLSGPAGGVSGAAFLASLAGHPDALGFDMGGTSTDVSLIQDGKPTISRQDLARVLPDQGALGRGAQRRRGRRLDRPCADDGGAAGGSGERGRPPRPRLLRPGRRPAHGDRRETWCSAGSRRRLLGGEMQLDVGAAEEAVGKTARDLGLDLHQAAQGILDIVNENMFGALRLVTVQKGLDPRDFALVAFGGAGPLHGNAMGILGGCYPVIVPPTPGVLSALGFLYSDIKNEFAHTLIRTLDEVRSEDVADALAGLGEEARGWLGTEGVPPDRQSIAFELDVRYFRQGYEFAIPVDPEALRAGRLEEAAERFGELHERQYGFRLDQPVELVNARAVAVGGVVKVEFPRFDPEGPDASGAVTGRHPVFFDGQFVTTNVYDRDRLRPGNRVPGPAVVTQRDSTTVVHPGHEGEVDPHLNILIRPAGGGSRRA